MQVTQISKSCQQLIEETLYWSVVIVTIVRSAKEDNVDGRNISKAHYIHS